VSVPRAETPARVGNGFSLLRLSPDESQLVGAGSTEGTYELTVYRPDARIVRVLRDVGKTEHVKAEVLSVAADNERIACGDQAGLIRIWDAQTLEGVAVLPKEHKRGVYSLALAGEELVSGSGDNTIKIWSVAKRACVGTLDEHKGMVIGLDASSDDAVSGTTIASGSYDTTCRVYKRAAGAGDNGASDDVGASLLHTLQHPGYVYAVHRRGDVLATGCDDKCVRTFSLSSGVMTRELRGHQSAVFCVVLSEALLLSGSDDKSVKLWALGDEKAPTKECVATTKHVSGVRGVVLVPSRGVAASLSYGTQGELLVWQPRDPNAAE